MGSPTSKNKDAVTYTPALEGRLLMTISQFCAAHGISRALYFKLASVGRGPTTVLVTPAKPMITREAAAEWRANLPQGNHPVESDDTAWPKGAAHDR